MENQPLSINPLQLATTEDLLEELQKRFEASVFTATRARNSDQRYRCLSVVGSPFEVYGLLMHTTNTIGDTLNDDDELTDEEDRDS